MVAVNRKRVNPPATILSFDCSAAACSAAVWRDGQGLAARFATMARGHAEALMPMILEAMAAAPVGFDDLDAIAVTVGPGSFTGIRIGLSVARGLGLSTGLPIIGLTTFAVVAAVVPASDRAKRDILVLLDSKRGDLYCQAFTGDLAPIGSAAIAKPEEVPDLLPQRELVAVGDGVPLARPYLPSERNTVLVPAETGLPNAAFMGALAQRFAASGEGLPPNPIYMRSAAVHPGGMSSAANRSAG